MNELTVQSNKALSAVDIKARKQLIQEVMKSVMIGPTKENPNGVHYGKIPGTNKNTLLKPGSEAILTTFRIAVDPVVEDLSREDCYRYRVTARGVLPTGEIVGAGVGEASTDEEKYRWRAAINKKEYDATPENRRRIKYCKPTDWNKDGEILQVRTNPADLANTVLKMAKKRAQIDLTLTATGASDVFEQDLDELSDELREELTGRSNGKPTVTPPTTKPKQQETKAAEADPAPEAVEGAVSPGQAKMLYAKSKSKGMDPDELCKKYNITKFHELPKEQFQAVMKEIDAFEATHEG